MLTFKHLAIEFGVIRLRNLSVSPSVWKQSCKDEQVTSKGLLLVKFRVHLWLLSTFSGVNCLNSDCKTKLRFQWDTESHLVEKAPFPHQRDYDRCVFGHQTDRKRCFADLLIRQIIRGGGGLAWKSLEADGDYHKCTVFDLIYFVLICLCFWIKQFVRFYQFFVFLQKIFSVFCVLHQRL